MYPLDWETTAGEAPQLGYTTGHKNMETQNFELGPALRGLGNPLRGTTTGNPKATKTEKFVRDGMQRANRNELLQRGTTTRHNNRVRHMLDKCDLKACCVYVCISAALANNDSLNAQSYRLCLWTAIKEANGFAIDFPSWWRTRRHQLPSAPDALPAAPPDGPQACIIFEDFKLNFEKFELWHLRQRGKILRDKHVHGMQQLFKELKPPQRDQIDLLWQNHDFTIMAIDFDTCQIDVDRPPPTIGQITWKIGSKELQHTNMVGTVLTFASLPDDLEPMDLLQCHQAFASSADLHAALLELWQPRWQKTSLVGGSEWARIVAFIEAYMPKMHFPAPTFDLQSWKSVLKRFPTRPARGVDGVSVEDLSHLPDVASQSLLDFLQRIDGVNTDWPEQLKYGTVISLSKRDDPHLAQHYRPVVILSCVYRAWARLWAQPLLHTLANLVPGNAYGFLPGRECAQVWIQLQGIIEVCLQQGISFSGFSTDIEKCFNNVGRDSLMKLAVHVGFPQRLLQAWRSFLDSFKRAFVVRTAHSEAIQSTQGLPEGCSMSVVGMVLIDWMLHTYLAALTPSVHAYSYVDNVSVAGHLTMEVVAAFFSTICFFELWGLSLDAGKTYFWSTHPKERALLQLLGLSLKSDAIELGGSMSFEAGRRNRLLKSRGASLLPKWQRLKRSVAPMACKLGALSSVFWPAALHGSPACQLPQSYFHALRQEANKALRCNQAGSNAKLRLSLADQAVADPGYYHLTSVIRTFRRVCGKSPVVLDCWRLWFSETTIEPTAGPFGVLLSALNDVGWQLLAPPLVVDHCGFEHDLLLAPLSLLLHLLDEAWLLKISHEVRERKTMNELFGIDRCTSQHGHAGLTAHERSLVSALQSGSFIDKWTHGRYDLTKDRLCSSCGIPETQDHLIVCPRFSQIRDDIGVSISEIQQWPSCTTQHLLVPKSPFLDELRWHLCYDVAEPLDFVSEPSGAELQHLFTDGSCFGAGRTELQRAAWGVYNHTTQLPVATGFVPGLLQSIDRGELHALLAALSWAAFYRCRIHVWLDSLYVHRGFQKRLAGYRSTSDEPNLDLWIQVEQMLDDPLSPTCSTTWVPSHLNVHKCESPLEEWIAVGNGAADNLAVRKNMARPPRLTELSARQQQWDDRACRFVTKMRQLYFAIFALTHAKPSATFCIPVASSSEDDSEGALYSFLDVFRPDADTSLFVQTLGYPLAFYHGLISWIRDNDDIGVAPKAVSFLEITVALCLNPQFQFPFRNAQTAEWELKDSGHLFERPTLAFYLQIAQKSLRFLVQHWCVPSPIATGINRTHLGITYPLQGLNMRLSSSVLASVSSRLALFTKARPIRRSCDLARPLC